MPEIKKYLNRDGLEEYNSLLPHSSGEMQNYVDDWLDAHPEATTTVQDGAISEPKLADKSVSLRTLADDTVHMLKGMMITGNLSGEVLTADDAYSAPPVALTVDGKSTQDGTPTPDAPVPIESVEVLNLPVTFAGKNLAGSFSLQTNRPSSQYGTVEKTATGFSYVGGSATSQNGIFIDFKLSAGKQYTVSFTPNSNVTNVRAYADKAAATQLTAITNGVPFTLNQDGYVRIWVDDATEVTNLQLEEGPASDFVPYEGHTVPIPLQSHVLRSLPDGTEDTMALTYLRPSTREGWAVYEVSLMQRVGETIIDGNHIIVQVQNANYLRVNINVPTYENSAAMADQLVWGNIPATNSMTIGGNRTVYAWLSYSDFPTLADYKAHLAEHPMTMLYALATPVTTQLDPVELPVLPAPSCTVWADPTTGMQMEYVRDSSLVIQRIEEAIADQ